EEKTEKEITATEEETKNAPVTKEEAKTQQNDSQPPPPQLKQSEEGNKKVVEKAQKVVSKTSAPKSYSQSRGGERKKMFVKLPSFTSQIATHKKEMKEIQL